MDRSVARKGGARMTRTFAFAIRNPEPQNLAPLADGVPPELQSAKYKQLVITHFNCELPPHPMNEQEQQYYRESLGLYQRTGLRKGVTISVGAEWFFFSEQGVEALVRALRG